MHRGSPTSSTESGGPQLTSPQLRMEEAGKAKSPVAAEELSQEARFLFAALFLFGLGASFGQQLNSQIFLQASCSMRQA